MHNNKNVKGKILLVYAINSYRGSKGIAAIILNLGIRW
jgi:hypothetical protein